MDPTLPGLPDSLESRERQGSGGLQRSDGTPSAVSSQATWTLANREGTIDSLYRKQIELSHGIDELRDNSLKAMTKVSGQCSGGGAITERYADLGDGRVELIFSDNGIGMSPGRLMEAVQINSQREELRSDRQGTSILGMGLWVALRALHPNGREDSEGFTRIYTSTASSASLECCRVCVKDIRDGGSPEFVTLHADSGAQEVSTFCRLVEECNELTTLLKAGKGTNSFIAPDFLFLGDPFSSSDIYVKNTEEFDEIDGISIRCSTSLEKNKKSLPNSFLGLSGTVIHTVCDLSLLYRSDETSEHGGNAKRRDFDEIINSVVNSMQHNYQFRSLQCIPIFVQRQRDKQFDVIRNRFYIPLDMEKTSLELDFEDGEFVCTDDNKLIVSHDAPVRIGRTRLPSGKVREDMHRCLGAARGAADSKELGSAIQDQKNAWLKFDVCSDHKFGLGCLEDNKEWKETKRKLLGYIKEENRPADENDVGERSLSRAHFMGIMMYAPIGPYPNGRRRLGPIIPYTNSKLFGNYSAINANSMNSHYPFKHGYLLRTEVTVSEECQRARLFNIDMVKSASRPLASVDGKLQAYMARLTWSVTRLLLAPSSYTKVVRKKLISCGILDYPYNEERIYAAVTSVGAESSTGGAGVARGGTSTDVQARTSGKKAISAGDIVSGRRKGRGRAAVRYEPVFSTSSRKKKRKGTKMVSAQKANAEKDLAIARERHKILNLCRKQELARYDRRWKRELVNPNSKYSRIRKKLVETLEKQSEKDDRSLEEAENKAIQTIDGKASKRPPKRRKTMSMLSEKFPVGMQVQALFADSKIPNHSEWYTGKVVGHAADGQKLYVNYEGDSRATEQSLQFCMNEEEFRELRPPPKPADVAFQSTHSLISSAAASSAAGFPVDEIPVVASSLSSVEDEGSDNIRVGPPSLKVADSAPNFSRAVPWFGN